MRQSTMRASLLQKLFNRSNLALQCGKALFGVRLLKGESGIGGLGHGASFPSLKIGGQYSSRNF
jgi:hypothetical protein